MALGVEGMSFKCVTQSMDKSVLASFDLRKLQGLILSKREALFPQELLSTTTN